MERISFTNKEGHQISGLLESPEGKLRGYAIFAHCFTCSKDIHAVVRISQNLAAAGIGVLRFDFTGLGSSGGDFSESNFTTNTSDLMSAYHFLVDQGRAPRLLIGHSLGGSAVLAAAAQMPEVRAVVTIGAPSDVDHVEHVFGSKVGEIEQKGESEVKLAGRSFLIKKQFLEDVRSINLEQKIPGINKALLIMHSPTDEVVEIDHAKEIFEASEELRGPRRRGPSPK